MRRVFVTTLPTAGARQLLSDDEANHVRTVLRLKEGDEVEVLNGLGTSVFATLQFEKKATWVEFQRVGRSQAALLPIELLLAVSKAEAMEWVIEKCVELQIARLQPFFASHSVVQTSRAKLSASFRQRWQKIAIEALKQSGQLTLLSINEPAGSLTEAMNVLEPQKCAYFCDETLAGEKEAPHLAGLLPNHPAHEPIRIIIGPEGGWSAPEREKARAQGYTLAALGSNVLRVETAALFAISLAVGRYLTSSSSTSKTNTELGGIDPTPRLP